MPLPQRRVPVVTDQPVGLAEGSEASDESVAAGRCLTLVDDPQAERALGLPKIAKRLQQFRVAQDGSVDRLLSLTACRNRLLSMTAGNAPS